MMPLPDRRTMRGEVGRRHTVQAALLATGIAVWVAVVMWALGWAFLEVVDWWRGAWG